MRIKGSTEMWGGSRGGGLGSAGFSLVEVLLVVALVSTLASAAYMGFAELAGAGSEAKLYRDVASVNAAVRAHALSGGARMPWGMDEVHKVIAQLKREARVEDKASVVGLTAAFVDRRLSIVLQTDEEAAKPLKRVLWNTEAQRFEIASSGPKGIREFYYDNALSNDEFGTEERRTSVEFARQDAWIWDFEEFDGGTEQDPLQISTSTPPTAQPIPPAPPERLELAAPTFSVPGGDYGLFEYESFILALENSNPKGVSEILYSINGGAFTYYVGPIKIDRDWEVSAYAHTLDPDHWEDSVTVTEIYKAVPIDLEIEVEFAKESFSYPELGGKVFGGDPGVFDPNPGTATLLNQDEIPTRYLNSSHFHARWSYDGSAPLESETATEGDPFADGFPPQPIGLTLDQWPMEAGTLTVQVAAKSTSPELFNDSLPQAVELSRRILTLPPPLITPAQGVIDIDAKITLELDLASRIIPPGTEIYYTTNGEDPGISASGRPLRGQRYTNPFVLFTDNRFESPVTARAYPPTELQGWYLASAPAEAAYRLETAVSSTLWAVAENGVGKLLQIRNYRTESSARIYDWGEIFYQNGSEFTTLTPEEGSFAVEALAITGSGIGYFVRNTPTSIDGTTWERALFSLDIASAAPGGQPVAQPVGDLGPVLTTYAGSLGGAEAAAVTGLSISPEGKLFGVFAGGRTSDPGSANYLFRIESLVADAGSALTDVTFVGRLTGEPGTATQTGDLAFSSGGVLYAADDRSNRVFEIDQDTAAIVSGFSVRQSTSYQGLATDPEDGMLIASNTGGDSANELVGVQPGAENDTYFFNYAQQSGYSDIRALSFWATDLTDPEPAPQGTVYAVGEGNRNIYVFDPDTGTSTILASGAPFGLNSLAHDPDSDRLYFVENAEAGFRLGRYDLGSGEFAVLGSLQDPALAYRPSALPQNLVFWCDSLWYIPAGSDDLIRVRIGPDGSIAGQVKLANISGDLFDFGEVGDIVADSEGTMTFVDGFGRLFSYSIPARAGFRLLAVGGEPLRGLVLDDGGQFFASLAGSLDDHQIYAINGSTGILAFLANTRPTVRFWDFAWGHSGQADRSDFGVEPMGRYGVIVFEDYQSNSDIGGHILVGGNLRGSKEFTYGGELAGLIPASETLLQVNGKVMGGNTIHIDAGSVQIGQNRGNRKFDMKSGGTVTENSPFDMSDTRAALESASLYLAGLAPNSSASVSPGQADLLSLLSGAPAGGVAIFRVDGGTLFSNPAVKDIQLDLRGASAAIINVSGTGNINWNHGSLAGYLLNDAAASTVIWNFYEASRVNLMSRRMNGAIMVPFGHLTHQGEIYGSVVARTAYSNGKLNRRLLRSDLISGLFEDPDPCLGGLSGGGSDLPPYQTPAPGIYVAGIFQRSGGGGRNVARLSDDGSLDESFDPGVGATAGSVVETLIELGYDGSVLAAGDFADMGGISRPAVVKINFDGSVSLDFNAALK
ncbi:hypothetical protein BH23VER1_BH23VER1_02400 [soil metagenome]